MCQSLFTARAMSDYSTVGRDTKLCDAGDDAASDDALPVLRACFTCSSDFMPSGRKNCFNLFFFIGLNRKVSCKKLDLCT